jgi:RNA polymerase sigma factor FliA
MPESVAHRDALILEGMTQVRLIARRIRQKLPGCVNLDDLISAGTLGLITAVDRYDAAQGVMLKTYAEYKIRGAILDSLRASDWAPRLQRKHARLIEAALLALEKRLQRIPREDEVAAELGIAVEEYRDWAADTNSLMVSSLDSVTSKEDGRDLIRFVADNDQLLPSQILEHSELRELVGREVKRMPHIERTILTMYYQQEQTLRQISRTLDMHESRISQLKTRAVLRLRSLLLTKWPERGQLMALA